MAACHAIAVPWLIFSRGNMTSESVGNVRFMYRWRWGLDRRFALGREPAVKKFGNRISRKNGNRMYMEVKLVLPMGCEERPLRTPS